MEALKCIEAVNGFILDGSPLKWVVFLSYLYIVQKDTFYKLKFDPFFVEHVLVLQDTVMTG